jgi:alcohol dehydrogenase
MSRFRFEYAPATLRAGPGAVDALADELDPDERALVVCGETVGSTPAVLDPVREGLGDRLADVFAGTTPAKRLGTAYDALAAMREADADVLVGLGGGSSLDVATVAALLAATDREPAAVGRELVETGTITFEGTPAPLVAVPTTLAGADLSQVAGVTADPATCPIAEAASGGVSDPALMPRAVVADPELVATTPDAVLRASAMNGFDKGVETLYAATATPVTDATARRGLALLADALPRLGERVDAARLEPVVEGLLLVQYGVSRPDATTLSLIHAFGHGLTRTTPLQQGVAHGIVAPHALRYLFDHVDGRRDLLADALVGGADDPAAAVVTAVERVRDGLGLPTRLRDVDGPDPETFPAVAEAVLADAFVANAPPGLDPTVEELVGVLEAAY